jgi:TRAP transporter TAXI family solute receptor
VATLYSETIHVVTLADSDVESLSDLSGRAVNTGDLGSGTQVNALQILEAAGVEEFDEQNAGFSQAADQLRNGDVAAVFVVGGWPVGAIEELATTNDISIVPIDGDLRESLMDEFAFYAEDEIPAETYNGVDEAVQTVAVQAMIATHEGLEADTVEQVTRAIFENTDQLSIKADFISEDTALDGMSIPLHPGAEAVLGPLEEDGEGTETSEGTPTDEGMTTGTETETTTEA